MVKISFIVLLIFLSALFSCSETAFTALSDIQLEKLNRAKGKRGRLVKKLTAHPHILLTTILIGNNLVNIATSALATQITIEKFGSQAVGLMTGLLTLIILIFAEVTPKQIALIHSETVALTAAYPVLILSIIFRPFIWGIGKISRLLTRLFAGKKNDTVAEEGIRLLLSKARTQGVVEAYEDDMIRGVFRINDVAIHAVMTHRKDVFSLDGKLTVNEVLPLIETQPHSRIPVFEDNPETIIGILTTSDLLATVARDKGTMQIRDLAMPPLFVPESKMLNDVLAKLKEAKTAMAVVIDEYGGLSGIVTIKDIIEEILGEVYDEKDLSDEQRISQEENGTFEIQGDTPLALLEDRLEIKLPHDKNIQTLGGWITDSIGRIPETGETISVSSGWFTVLAMQKNRILTVLYTPGEEPPRSPSLEDFFL